MTGVVIVQGVHGLPLILVQCVKVGCVDDRAHAGLCRDHWVELVALAVRLEAEQWRSWAG